MSLLAKSIIAISLIIFSLGIFTFHWFFVDKTMPVSECLSANCVYSSLQAVPPEAQIMLTILVALFSLLIADFASIIAYDNLTATLGRYNLFRKRFDTFCYKFYSWLNILEKRDAQTALVAVRFDE